MNADKAFARAMDLSCRYLAIRPRSRAEIFLYLAKKQTPERIIEQAAAALTGYGYIDDRKFALQYGKAVRDRKGLSRYALRAELRRKGVSDDDIASALDELYSVGEEGEDVEESVALAAAKKKMASMRSVEPEKARRRLIDYLRRRGFNFGIIKKALGGLDDDIQGIRR